MTEPSRTRLDVALVERGLASTRARARDAILRGHVVVDGTTATRPAAAVASAARIAVTDPAANYVSRSALKLAAGLEAFSFSAEDVTALDLGASTGGFTQVLLERGARRVYAIDVGHGQLDPAIAADSRVISSEGINGRDLKRAHVPEVLDAVVADVSFISLRLVLAPALALAGANAWGIFLVKPQFEVGPKAVGKGGIVRDPAVAEGAAFSIADWLRSELGWQVVGLIPSPVLGGNGNREFLLGARRGSTDGGR